MEAADYTETLSPVNRSILRHIAWDRKRSSDRHDILKYHSFFYFVNYLHVALDFVTIK
jgi:hypothetical protein